MDTIKMLGMAAAVVAGATLPFAANAETGGKAPVFQKYTCDEKTYVPFDATTTVTLACPDPSAAKWLESHFKEWYGDAAPKVTTGPSSVVPPEDVEGYAATVDETGVNISANTLAGTRRV